MESKNVNTSYFWDEILSKKSYIDDFGSVTRDRIKIAKEFRKSIGKRVLNIGSGQGFLESEFSDELGSGDIDFHSMDISPKGLGRIKTLFKTITKEGTVLDLPYKTNYFDTLYCLEVLEHIEKKDTKKAYKEIKRVIKQGGEVIISVPVNETRSLINHPVGHVKKYVPKSIEKELEEQGFEITDKKYLYAFPSFYRLKSLVAKLTGFWQPNIAIMRCVL